MGEFGEVEVEAGGGDVFFEVLDAGSAGDGKDVGRTGEEPSKSDLRGSGFELSGDLGDGAIGASEFSSGEGEPGDEREIVFFAVVEDVFGAAIGEAVAILDADDGNAIAGVLNLLDGNFGEADETDFAFGLKGFESGELLVGGNFGIDAV